MDAASEAEYVYEPEVGVLLAELLPRYVNVQVYRGLLDTSASENAAAWPLWTTPRATVTI